MPAFGTTTAAWMLCQGRARQPVRGQSQPAALGNKREGGLKVLAAARLPFHVCAATIISALGQLLQLVGGSHDRLLDLREIFRVDPRREIVHLAGVATTGFADHAFGSGG